MSKKMFKRSLALGALMAFVITGSAMAAEVVTPNHQTDADEAEIITVVSLDKDGILEDSFVSDDNSGKYSDKFIFDLNNYDLTVNGKIQCLGLNEFDINGTGSTLTVNGNLYGKGTVDIGSLIINEGALRTYGSQKMTINAGSVYIENKEQSGAYGVNLQGEGSQVGGGITIVTNLLSIANCDKYVFRTAYETILDITADEVSITGEKQSISKATGQSNIILNVKEEGTINCDFQAGEGGTEKGTINLTLGSGVNWTGKIATDSGSASVGTLDLSGTWNLTEASSLTEATFNAGSVLKINGADFTGNDIYALNGVGKDAVLKVGNDAKIEITGGKVDSVYNVAKDFATNEGANWTLQADNALWYVDWTLDETVNALQGKILAKTAEDMVNTGVATNDNKEIMLDIATAPEGKNATADAINELASSSNVTAEDIQKGAAALLQVGEAGGFTGNVVSVSKQVNGSVGARNSFSGPKHGGPRHRGGHGPSVSEEANGSAIWAQYVHGKDKVDGIDMGGVENAYESQFNGVVLGADFKQVGSYASGIAFNYGEGDSHSKKNVVQSDSEFDFWGVSYYGAVKKQDTNFIFDIGYSESDSDVEQKFGGNTITANPEASTWTAGVKVEKLIDKGAVQIVPYAGLRFLTIDTDDYEAKGGTASEATYYSTERQNIWLLPVGVSLSQENVYDSGWIVTPKADLSYTWAMGDTDSSMTVNMPNVGSDTLGYTVMDDGSFMATVGLDAQKEDWTFGVAYSYQKGDSTRSDRWYVNARYSF